MGMLYELFDEADNVSIVVADGIRKYGQPPYSPNRFESIDTSQLSDALEKELLHLLRIGAAPSTLYAAVSDVRGLLEGARFEQAMTLINSNPLGGPEAYRDRLKSLFGDVLDFPPTMTVMCAVFHALHNGALTWVKVSTEDFSNL